MFTSLQETSTEESRANGILALVKRVAPRSTAILTVLSSDLDNDSQTSDPSLELRAGEIPWGGRKQ